jgi:tight adherence protein B
MTPGLLAGFVFLIVVGAVVGISMVASRRSKSTLEKSLEDRWHELAGVAPVGANTDGSSVVRTVKAGPLPNLDRIARRAIQGSSLETWLEQSGTGITPSSFVITSVGLGVISALMSVMFSNHGWVMPIAFLFGSSLPTFVLRRSRTKRLYKFEEHFPEALDLMSRSIRAGHAFSAGMKMVADECPDPIGPEFRKAFDEQNFGLPLKESLNNLAGRVPLLDVKFFSTAVLIQRDTGGNLSEILDNLANVVRERFKIRRQVRVHTAHGRFTGYVLLALPAFLGFALSIINPDHMKMLFEDKIGQMMIVAAIVMQGIGFIWIKQVVKIEV